MRSAILTRATWGRSSTCGLEKDGLGFSGLQRRQRHQFGRHPDRRDPEAVLPRRPGDPGPGRERGPVLEPEDPRGPGVPGAARLAAIRPTIGKEGAAARPAGRHPPPICCGSNDRPRAGERLIAPIRPREATIAHRHRIIRAANRPCQRPRPGIGRPRAGPDGTPGGVASGTAGATAGATGAPTARCATAFSPLPPPQQRDAVVEAGRRRGRSPAPDPGARLAGEGVADAPRFGQPCRSVPRRRHGARGGPDSCSNGWSRRHGPG